MSDMVNHPPHYQGDRFESIDIIEAYALGFHLGNALKYIVRHEKKGGRQDLKKALWYLRRFVDNGSAYNAQKRAWNDDEVFGIKDISIEEISRDFGLSEALREAVFRILMQNEYKGDIWITEAIQSIERELAKEAS